MNTQTPDNSELAAALDIAQVVQCMATASAAQYSQPQDCDAAAQALIQRVIEQLLPPGSVVLRADALAGLREILGDAE